MITGQCYKCKHWKSTFSNTKTTCALAQTLSNWICGEGLTVSWTPIRKLEYKDIQWENQWEWSRRRAHGSAVKVVWKDCHFGSNATACFHPPLLQLRANMATKARWFPALSYWTVRGPELHLIIAFFFYRVVFLWSEGAALQRFGDFFPYLFFFSFLSYKTCTACISHSFAVYIRFIKINYLIILHTVMLAI